MANSMYFTINIIIYLAICILLGLWLPQVLPEKTVDKIDTFISLYIYLPICILGAVADWFMHLGFASTFVEWTYKEERYYIRFNSIFY